MQPNPTLVARVPMQAKFPRFKNATEQGNALRKLPATRRIERACVLLPKSVGRLPGSRRAACGGLKRLDLQWLLLI
jgi:hypothetical protein